MIPPESYSNMKDGNRDHREPRPLELTRQQQDVIRALRGKQNDKYPLSEWYLGALYALNHHHNPDRISQAAHSLRELLEKLPRLVLETDAKVGSFNLQEHSRDILARLIQDRERYPEGWEAKPIDPILAETLDQVALHFERRQQPSRKERIQMSLLSTDPLARELDAKLLASKRDRISKLGKRLEDYTHHGAASAATDFGHDLELLERVILDLLAPITAQDQQEIQAILDQHDRTDAEVDRLFTLMEKSGANYTFFFTHATDPSWIPTLRDRGYLSDPPHIEQMGDEEVRAPIWWPLHYLFGVVKDAPDEVLRVLLQLPKLDNPQVTRRILDIACELPGVQSRKLKSRVIDFGQWDFPFLGLWYCRVLAHWVKENETRAALDLAEVLVQFDPDPEMESKRNSYGEAGPVWTSPIRPVPKLEEWEYLQMLEDGVRPLAQKEPYAVARILINATERMIKLRTQEESESARSDDDLSELWCNRLGRVDNNYEQSSSALVASLTFACEQVFENDPSSIANLDDILRTNRRTLFKRLRQHLYALYPTEQTKPWIRDFILQNEDYSLWKHHYEFQQMVQSACNHFSEELLSNQERVGIFDAILSAPPKERYMARQGDGFNEELFQQHQRYFHRMQLKPFSAVLFGGYASYFQELEGGGGPNITDDSYLSFGDTKPAVEVLSQSPQPLDYLTSLTDEDLLDYINRWNEEHTYFTDRDGDESLVEVNIEGLAAAFTTVFRHSILPDSGRLQFWLGHVNNIERPIYVRVMVNSMEAYAKERTFDRLHESLTLCEWVLSHPDQDSVADSRYKEQSRDNPGWHSSRCAVGDFIRTCLEDDVAVPISSKGHLAKLLDMLCTQFDSQLDGGHPVFSDRNDQFTEAINNTRSSALESLVKFGFWLRKNDSEADIPLVMEVLQKRFSVSAEFPLTLPERAMLGVNYGSLLSLDEVWITEHRSDFFPQDALLEWRAAFGTLLRFTHPNKSTFDTLHSQFEFAIENLPHLEEDDDPGPSLTNTLGQHLFVYYLWGMYPLKGEKSLLDR